MNVSIAKAGHEDLDTLALLLQQLFAIEEDFCFEPVKVRRGLERLLADERACVFVARNQGKVVGMCSAQLVISTAEGAYSAWVEDVVVDPDHRRQGIGGLLLDGLSHWARENGATRMQLLADSENTPALEFYRRSGWSQTRLIALRASPLV